MNDAFRGKARLYFEKISGEIRIMVLKTFLKRMLGETLLSVIECYQFP